MLRVRNSHHLLCNQAKMVEVICLFLHLIIHLVLIFRSKNSPLKLLAFGQNPLVDELHVFIRVSGPRNCLGRDCPVMMIDIVQVCETFCHPRDHSIDLLLSEWIA